MTSSPIELPTLDDDGLLTPDVGDWAEDKYRLVKLYATLFTTSMRGKWDELVYVDLFAGAGHAAIRGTQRIVPASPLVALNIDHRFDRYVFSEADSEKLDVLKKRVQRGFPDVDCRFVAGDVNENVSALLEELPQYHRGRKVLGFCFADPYRLSHLKFETIAALASRYMDFLVLIPSGMDAHRNESIYTKPSNTTLDEFFGRTDWREEWAEEKKQGRPFERFVTDAFGESMKRLDYLYEEIENPLLVRLTEKNVPLYRLALFSRHPLGGKFWKAARKSADPQRSLF